MGTIAAFWNWLMRTSWQGSILVLLVLAVQWAFRHKLSARWRYALWFVVLSRLVMPVVPSSGWSIFNYAPIGTSPVEAAVPGNRGQAGRLPALPTEAYSAPSPVVLSKSEALDKASEAPGAALQPATGKQAGGFPPRQFDRWSLKRLLPLLWLCGAFIIALRIAGQNIWFSIRLRAARRLQDPTIQDLLDSCRAGFGIRSRVRLAETDAVTSPALYGLVRPVLLLPKQMVATFNHQELRYVFLHELAHVKRRDMAVHWLATALKVLHWFNPLLWFAFYRVAIDRELACDELALSRAEEAENKGYGETIIKLLETASRPEPFAGLVGILEHRDQMVRRISMIANFKRRSRWSVLAVLLLLSLAMICLTDAQPERAIQKAPASGASPDHVALESLAGTPTNSTSAGLSYRGKSAEEWLNQIDFKRGLNDKAFGEAERAFVEMGQVALPFVCAKLAAPKTPAEGKRTAEARRKAAWVLKTLGPVAEPAVPDLRNALEDEDDSVTAYAAMALGEIGPKARPAVPALFKSLRFGNGPAAAALVKIDPDNPLLVPTLIEVLKNPNSSPQGRGQAPQYAAMALQKLGPKAKAAVPALRDALPSPFAAWALLSIAWDEPDVVAQANAAVKAKSSPPEPLDLEQKIEAVEKAGRGNYEIQMAFGRLANALRIAKFQGTPVSDKLIQERILPLFSKALDDPDPKVWGAAAAASGCLGPAGQPLLPKLIALLERDNSGDRANVLGALSSIAPGSPSILPVLIPLLKDWNDGVRNNACNALTHYGSEAREAVPALRECLKDRSTWVRFNATVALWRIAHEEPSILVMQEALRENPGGGYVFKCILEMLGGSSLRSEETLSILRELTQLGDSEDRTNAQALLEKLGKKPPVHEESSQSSVERPAAEQVASAALVGASAKPVGNPAVPLVSTPPIPPALGPLIKKLRSRDADVRLDGAGELARMGTRAQAAIPFVLGLLKESDADTRAYVVSTLADLDPSGTQVLPALEQALGDPSPEVRANALVSLKKIGPQAASSSSQITQAMQDTNPAVRLAARQALAAIESQASPHP